MPDTTRTATDRQTVSRHRTPPHLGMGAAIPHYHDIEERKIAYLYFDLLLAYWRLHSPLRPRSRRSPHSPPPRTAPLALPRCRRGEEPLQVLLAGRMKVALSL